jgi:23S rRNA (pseudouridine1915-N3)-methyltransferase
LEHFVGLAPMKVGKKGDRARFDCILSNGANEGRLSVMHIQILTVGKLKERYLVDGIAEYVKRLGPYAKVQMIEVPDEKAPENMSPAEEQQVRVKEGERLLAKLAADVYVVALAIDGEMWTSEQLAGSLDKLATYGRSQVAFVIGGSLGLSSEVLRRADMRLSFGRMTLPHQLMRLVLVEQIYRAMRINRGEPYHK